MITDNVEESDIIMVVAPSDIGSYRRYGQKKGAYKIYEMIKELETDVKILDYGELFLEDFDLNKTHKIIEEEITKIKEFNKPILLIGGDHSISYGSMRSFPKAQVHVFDAHPDLVMEEDITCQSFLTEFKSRLSLHGTRYFTTQEKKTMEQLTQCASNEVYISLDIDVLDPTIMPGVAYPVKNGWIIEQLLNEIKETVKDKKIVCIDIVEFCPLVEEMISSKTLKEVIKPLLKIIKV